MSVLSSAPCAIVAAILVLELVSGRALNPIRGAWPFVVERKAESTKYWISIAIHAAILALFLMFALPILFA
jgi:hypothetical protein